MRRLKAWAQSLEQLPLPLEKMPAKAVEVKQARQPVQRPSKSSVVARRLPGLE